MGKNLNELASYMLPKVQALIDQANAAGLDVIIEDTGRTPVEQQVKLAQGVSWTTRSKHLPQPPEMKSEAIDLVPRAVLTLKYWGWNGTPANSHGDWLQLGELGESLGLEWGGRWTRCPSDPGHFQYKHVETSIEDIIT
jgi:peptidoglycan L-alanyl-D-glutamate endopeptidase CwlK